MTIIDAVGRKDPRRARQRREPARGVVPRAPWAGQYPPAPRPAEFRGWEVPMCSVRQPRGDRGVEVSDPAPR